MKAVFNCLLLLKYCIVNLMESICIYRLGFLYLHVQLSVNLQHACFVFCSSSGFYLISERLFAQQSNLILPFHVLTLHIVIISFLFFFFNLYFSYSSIWQNQSHLHSFRNPVLSRYELLQQSTILLYFKNFINTQESL